jgi:hypothetical protein
VDRCVCRNATMIRSSSLRGEVSLRLLLRGELVQTRRSSKLTIWSRSKAPVRPWSHSK